MDQEQLKLLGNMGTYIRFAACMDSSRIYIIPSAVGDISYNLKNLILTNFSKLWGLTFLYVYVQNTILYETR